MPRGCCAHRVSDASNKVKKSAIPFLTITPFEIGGNWFLGGFGREHETSPLLTQGMQKSFGGFAGRALLRADRHELLRPLALHVAEIKGAIVGNSHAVNPIEVTGFFLSRFAHRNH